MQVNTLEQSGNALVSRSQCAVYSALKLNMDEQDVKLVTEGIVHCR
jgi:hypothetical protein